MRISLVLLSLLLPMIATAQPTLPILPPAGRVTASTVIDQPGVLRGYGKVKATLQTVTSGDASYQVWQFAATSPTNAATVAGKFLADLNLSPGVETGTLTVNGQQFPLVTVTGGSSYAGFVSGKVGCVVAAASTGALKNFLTTSPAAVGKVMTDLPYPQYLDRFDRYGWGFYGFRGNWNTPPRPGETDPVADLDFCAKYKFRIELWPKPTEFDDSYSVPETHEMGWIIAESAKRGIPMSGRLYGNLPRVKEFADAFEQPLSFMEGGWYWATLGWRGIAHQSWYHPEGRLYIARQAQDEMRLLADRPDIGSWMLPYGEISYYDWYAYHADRSPAAVADWRRTLRVKHHLTLPEVSAMFHRAAHPFRSWDEVPIPEVATFAGLPGIVQDLEGEWSVRPESQPEEGIQGAWWNADINAAPWEHMHMPGSVFWFRHVGKTKWAARDFEVTHATLAGGRTLYLYSFARANNNDPRKVTPLYLNGQKLGDVRTWGAWAVTHLLKPGPNRLAFPTDLFGGRIFVSTEPPAVYPYLGPERNRLWLVFNDWLLDAKHDTCAIALAAMRQVDPNRPIKIMAPTGIGSDRWLDLGNRFGAWGHFTGEGVWAFFWYKRYGFLYGLPGTSEGGGPSGTVEDQVRLYQRVFLEGLNGHDQVFTTQDITSKPDLKQWYENHIAVLKQLGRWDIAGPQVIQFRATNVATRQMPEPHANSIGSTREIQSYWNWDFARGAFQSIGQSGLYLDDSGLAAGKNAGYPILLDSGNEIITPESLRHLGEWVRNGGTYIVLPFTGRSLPTEPDSWPIRALTGCEIKAQRKPGPGSGTITIAKDQPLFTELAGKTFPDAGSSMDFQDFEHNLLSTELTPGPDCKVVARFENGSPAIVVHKLGAGRVIVLGSAFFRQSHDVMGIWWPGELESVFLRDLLTNLGQPSVNNAGDYRVFTQRYRTNNGLDDVVVVDNFADGDRTINLRADVGGKPASVWQVAMNEVREVPFSMEGKTVVVPQIAIPKGEVQIYYFRGTDPTAATGHWWGYQQKLWKPAEQVKVDLSPIAKGRWVDPTLDLKRGWQWTQEPTAGDAWTRAGFDDHGWQAWDLDIFNAVGADPTKPIHARKTFTIPAAWLRDGGLTKLIAAGWSWPFTTCDGPWQLTLNGQLLQKPGFFNPDVTSLLRKGPDVLALELGIPKRGHYIGVLGSVYLTHSARPVQTVNLAGTWTSNFDGKPLAFQMPGKTTCFAPTRSFDVPADWEKKYIVTWYAKGSRESTAGVIVNETGMTRRHHHLFGDEVEVDITSLLRFGATNTFAMLPTPGDGMPLSKDWDLSAVELRLYPRAQFRSE